MMPPPITSASLPPTPPNLALEIERGPLFSFSHNFEYTLQNGARKGETVSLYFPPQFECIEGEYVPLLRSFEEWEAMAKPYLMMMEELEDSGEDVADLASMTFVQRDLRHHTFEYTTRTELRGLEDPRYPTVESLYFKKEIHPEHPVAEILIGLEKKNLSVHRFPMLTLRHPTTYITSDNLQRNLPSSAQKRHFACGLSSLSPSEIAENDRSEKLDQLKRGDRGFLLGKSSGARPAALLTSPLELPLDVTEEELREYLPEPSTFEIEIDDAEIETARVMAYYKARLKKACRHVILAVTKPNVIQNAVVEGLTSFSPQVAVRAAITTAYKNWKNSEEERPIDPQTALEKPLFQGKSSEIGLGGRDILRVLYAESPQDLETLKKDYPLICDIQKTLDPLTRDNRGHHLPDKPLVISTITPPKLGLARTLGSQAKVESVAIQKEMPKVHFDRYPKTEEGYERLSNEELMLPFLEQINFYGAMVEHAQAHSFDDKKMLPRELVIVDKVGIEGHPFPYAHEAQREVLYSLFIRILAAKVAFIGQKMTLQFTAQSKEEEGWVETVTETIDAIIKELLSPDDEGNVALRSDDPFSLPVFEAIIQGFIDLTESGHLDLPLPRGKSSSKESVSSPESHLSSESATSTQTGSS